MKHLKGDKGTGDKGNGRQRRREADKREHRRKGGMEEETMETGDGTWKRKREAKENGGGRRGRGRGFFSRLTSDVSPFFHLSPFTFHHKKVPLD
ncbi:hypothetical protein L0U88_11820 [Flavihumibacter sp. RY-1]|uniref:Uncharacterized protein n=1 Tax=Flavihumibacter fluminis TaxID=2909236 RepID=A0ABS9BL03_9BACT|nr:hypothetical protein [Flavihumibacter fluminis]MCF1715316.1 hypothetical protein [Flavihumibacter fluminis]